MDRKQQLLLEQFYKEFTTWCPEHVGYHYAGIFMLGLAMIMYCMPAQLLEGDYSILLHFLGMELLGMGIYLQKYTVYMEKGKTRSLDEVLRYLPVSRRQRLFFRFKKLFRICAWMTGIALFCQITFSVSFLHGLIWQNIAVPLVCNFVIPMSLNGLSFLCALEGIIKG